MKGWRWRTWIEGTAWLSVALGLARGIISQEYAHGVWLMVSGWGPLIFVAVLRGQEKK